MGIKQDSIEVLGARDRRPPVQVEVLARAQAFAVGGDQTEGDARVVGAVGRGATLVLTHGCSAFVFAVGTRGTGDGGDLTDGCVTTCARGAWDIDPVANAAAQRACKLLGQMLETVKARLIAKDAAKAAKAAKRREARELKRAKVREKEEHAAILEERKAWERAEARTRSEREKAEKKEEEDRRRAEKAAAFAEERERNAGSADDVYDDVADRG